MPRTPDSQTNHSHLTRALFARPLRAAIVALAGLSLLLAACDDTDAAGDDPTTTPSPTPTATASGTPDTPTPGSDTGGAAGGDIEPANPEEPPEGVLNAGSGSVPLGLGTYCWSPPTGSGKPALCVDKIGLITSPGDLVVQPGEDLTVTGDEILMPPMTIAYAYLYPAPADPLDAGEEYRAWTPDSMNEHTIEFSDRDFEADILTLPADLEPGRYLLAVNYTAGPDRGSEATYGAILVVE